MQFVDEFLEILNDWQLLLDRLRKLPSHVIGQYSYRLADVLQSEFNDRSTFGLTEKNTDARSAWRRSHRSIDCGEIEAKFAGVLGLERSDLKFEDEVAVQTYVVKEQVEVERLTIDREWDLTSYEGEAASEFQEQVSQVSKQAALDLPFFRCLGCRLWNCLS
jgi:hypothetical protein